jgi:AhpD family alkylhydroperoxidase
MNSGRKRNDGSFSGQNKDFICIKSQRDKGIKLDDLEEFRRYRERMNERILSANNLGIKRFFALDDRAYEKGALSAKTKELMGLVASTVLRCNECITYHVIRCVQEGISDQEFFEALNVALIVGGSITIPHIRRAVDMFDQCRKKQSKGQAVKV